jgi:hypothetical protein
MKVQSITMSQPTVRALLANDKTQTMQLTSSSSRLRTLQPGDLLYVRERFHPWTGSASGRTIVYTADDRWIDWGSGENFIDKVEWLTVATPAVCMPRWASRLTLQIEAVKKLPTAVGVRFSVIFDNVDKVQSEQHQA